MNLKETFNQAKEICSQPRFTCLKADNGLNDIDCQTVDMVAVHHDYPLEVPAINIFPCLKVFHSTKEVAKEYIASQDWSNLTEIYLCVENRSGTVKIEAQNVVNLTVYINNNEEAQLNLNTFGERIIDLSGCPNVKKLNLRHASGYDLYTDKVIPSVEVLIVENWQGLDCDVLRFFPNLKKICIYNSNLQDTSFVSFLPELRELDLSYNCIQDTTPLSRCVWLKELNLYRNPCDDKHIKAALPNTRVVVTPKDKEILSVESSLKSQANLAYSTLVSRRKNFSSMPPFMQRIYGQKMDEELFGDIFISCVKSEIERISSGKAIGTRVKLSADELKEIAIKEYPFLRRYL